MTRTLGPVLLVLLALVLSSCSALRFAPAPTRTPYPTYTPAATCTPLPTYTPYPTATPQPSATPTPITRVGEWLSGHYWSIQVSNVRTATVLDGVKPTNSQFVVVDVQWKANNTLEFHYLSGQDFVLIDEVGKEHLISGTIMVPDGKPAGSPAVYEKGVWQYSRAKSNATNVYQLVYDLPASVRNLKLWFADLPMIDLGL